MRSEGSGWTFPPLLARIQDRVSLWDREGEFSLDIDAFGQVSCSFVTTDVRRAEVPGRIGSTDVHVDIELPDGREIVLTRCAIPHRRVRFAMDVDTTEDWQFLPTEVTVRAPSVRPTEIQFGIANLWFMAEGALAFGGHSFDMQPNPRNHYGPLGSDGTRLAPVTHWATTDAPLTGKTGDVWDCLRCLTDTASMLCHERIASPCYRLVDSEGRVGEFHHELQSQWPAPRKHHLLYTRDHRSALEAVGSSEVTKRFRELDLVRYVHFVLEARRDDLPVELGLASVLFALECLSGRWQIVERGSDPNHVAKRKLVEKLRCMNEELGCVDSKYLGDWLRARLRNPLMHSGAVPTMTVSEIHEATEELLVLATRIFFRLFGFVPDDTPQGQAPVGCA